MESVFLWVGLVLVAIVLLALLRDDWLFITRPPIGTRITLTYPKGAADKARVQERSMSFGVIEKCAISMLVRASVD
jgi:hypothetical protein